MHSNSESFLGIETRPVPVGETANESSLRIPTVVRAYGVLIMIINGLGMAAGAISALLSVSQSASMYVLVAGGIGIVINFVFFRLGMGLHSGERQAVYGLCVLGTLGLLAAIAVLASGATSAGLLLLTIVAVLYIPPLVSAFRHWSAFN